MATSTSADVPAGLDPVLAPFVAAEDEESARGALGVVLETHALPIVRAVVRRELAGGTGRGASEADLEDVAGTVVVRLTVCLMRAAREWDARGPREDAGGEPIGNLRAYAGQMAANACAEWLRERFPLRARLTAQIRYACRHHRELALWLWRERVWLCGLAPWRDVRDPVDSGVLDALRGRLAAPVPPVISEAKRIVTALFAVLREVDGPCRLGETVTIVADLLGIPERMSAAMGERAHHARRGPAKTRTPRQVWRRRSIDSSSSAISSRGSGARCARCRSVSAWPCCSTCATKDNRMHWC